MSRDITPTDMDSLFAPRPDFVGAPAEAGRETTTDGCPVMCWKCDDPDGAEEAYLDYLRDMMRDHHGWQVQFVEHDKRPFAYTVGLHDRGLPELLITGLSEFVSNRVLGSIGHMIVDAGISHLRCTSTTRTGSSSRSSRSSTQTCT
jgi:hypothetical protein